MQKTVSPIVTASLMSPPPPPKPLHRINSSKLSARGLSSGLIKVIKESTQTCAIRYWIVDNSGSMQIQDGKKFLRTSDGTLKSVSCSRWEELGESLKWHGETAKILDAHTEFRLLNPPTTSHGNLTSWFFQNNNQSVVPQTVIIGNKNDNGSDDNTGLSDLYNMVKTNPGGGTPLCATLRQVVSEIIELSPTLRAENKKVSLIVASDGEASDGNVSEVLQPLVGMPCDVVIRLCTDDDNIVNYWNNIDADLEIDLDVLDDMEGEANEVCQLNPWLTYSESLHRLREWGNMPKIFDLLDERTLSPSEAQQFINFILGDIASDLPHPELEGEKFISQLSTALCGFDEVYDAYTKKMKPLIDLHQFERKVLKIKGGFGEELCTACVVS